MDIRHYFLLFLGYSILGWTIETIDKLLENKKFVNRGFLLGPYCPIYGIGCVLIITLLNKYIEDPIILFFMSIIICSILEYSTSYIMEKIFKARWWDYSKCKYNINGRICLDTMIPFGILSLLLMYVLNPFYMGVITSLNNVTLDIIFGLTLLIFISDVVLSLIIINKLRLPKLEIKDSTEEISKEVREILKNGSKLKGRLLNAFPDMKVSNLKRRKKKIVK